MNTLLTLGTKTFLSNLIQGPLAGVSCAPFRRLVWQFSKPAFTCTEMISCKTLLHKPTQTQQRFIAKDPQEGPLCFQLAASNPLELGEATKIATAQGADLIDLNCGCPVKKIRSKGMGSSLLTNPTKLYKSIRAMKNNTHVPVSIKIRVQGCSDEKFNHEVARVVAEAGADFLIVHGRHWSENYGVPCRHDEIRFFVEALNIPVIGNGDIADVESLLTMLATGCAGVMIGRAGVGQPWLISQLTAALAQEKFTPPTLPVTGELFIAHIEQLAILLDDEKLAVLQARKLSKYYARRLPDAADFCAAANTCSALATLIAVTHRYFNAT